MEKPPIIEAKKDKKDEKDPFVTGVDSHPTKDESSINAEKDEAGHLEAVTFVEKHRDFFEHYAKGRIRVEPAPEGLNTFAFDLKNDTIFVNSMFYKDKGYSEEKTLFAICHEIEHFMEKKAMITEPERKEKGRRKEEPGEKKFEQYIERIKKDRAFGLMDNCVADIRENRSVISRTNKGMIEVERKIYREDLFIETDFTKQSRHVQFCQAILRESKVEDEKCKVDSEVRKALDEVKAIKGLMEIMTHPETPMSTRLKLQEKYVWPKVIELLEKDLEDKKKENQRNKDEEKEKNKNKEDKEKQNQSSGGDEEEEEDMDGGSQKEGEGKVNKDSDDGQDSHKKENQSGEGDGEQELDPNKEFGEEYDELEGKLGEAVPLEEVEKALKEWKEEKKNDSPDKADEEYATKLGVEKKDLQEYRKIIESLAKIVNPETNVAVLEELKTLFSRIISKRMKPQSAPKYPVEEGDELVDPAQLVADVKAGNLYPKVWEDQETVEKKGDRFGEVEITLVCDRSGSMQEGNKAREQRRSTVLVMEALKDFAELCEEEKMRVDKPLVVKSEIYSFASSHEDKTPLKKMSAELGEAERINILKKLYDLPGSTTDFNCLQAINENLNREDEKKIKEGELKKIVIVFTDGGSDSPRAVEENLAVLREKGVVAIGVGMTEAGKPVLATYAPNAMVVEDISKLPLVLGDLLKEHLKDL